jgi:hypothetical protein
MGEYMYSKTVYGRCRLYVWVIKQFVESAPLNDTDDFHVRRFAVPYFHVCGECVKGTDHLTCGLNMVTSMS